ncbi:hemerythrin domain-containing protein [Patescibacteria group bacterium]
MANPINILIVEHTLIKKMLNVIRKKIDQMRESQEVDLMFIDIVVDFFKTFVDRIHHGKEEKIFFHELSQKNLTEEHKNIVNRLENDHKKAKETVGKIIAAKHKYNVGDQGGLKEFMDLLEFFLQMYPPHIKIEDETFFYEAIKYFNPEEQNNLFERFNSFDPELNMEKYSIIVENLEQE